MRRHAEARDAIRRLRGAEIEAMRDVQRVTTFVSPRSAWDDLDRKWAQFVEEDAYLVRWMRFCDDVAWQLGHQRTTVRGRYTRATIEPMVAAPWKRETNPMALMALAKLDEIDRREPESFYEVLERSIPRSSDRMAVHPMLPVWQRGMGRGEEWA